MRKLNLKIDKLIFLINIKDLKDNDFIISSWNLDFSYKYSKEKFASEKIKNYDLKIKDALLKAYKEWEKGERNFEAEYLKRHLEKKNTVKENIIYENLIKIEPGKTLSYSQLALKGGFNKNYARFVGNCMRKNKYPLLYPCHRIIKGNGEISAYTTLGGEKLKKFLLKIERNT